MEYVHEIIDFGSNIPLKLFLHKVGEVHRHWHQSLELLMVLSGSVTINVDNNTYLLQENDVILINSNHTHELHGDNCVLVALQIKLTMFDKRLIDADAILFDCNSTSYRNKSKFDNLKSIVAEMVKFNSENKEANDIMNKALAYRVLYELMTKFKSDDTAKNYLKTKKNLDRLTSILNYLEESYHENISLKILSEREFLSISYLSRFFEKNMGINFSSYLNNIRLTHAVEDLLATDLSIEDVSQKNGFPNPRAFVSLFKKEYGILPSQYRKTKILPGEHKNTQAEHGSLNYLKLEQSGHLARLAEYLEQKKTEPVYEEPSISISETEDIDISHRLKSLRHTFKTFISVGRAKEIFFAEIQEMLKTVQKEIGFKYIKFHGLFDDEMMVYAEKPDGTPDLNFVYVDRIFDFLLSINLKPFVQFSFMPKMLAKDPQKTVFYHSMITSEPNNMDHWNALVTGFMKHVISRYGFIEVSSWLFSVWNEPDSPIDMFGFENDDIFNSLYYNTYSCVKGVDSRLSFGSPSLITPTIENGAWMTSFVQFCSQNQCLPDFVVFHFYPVIMEENELTSMDAGKDRLILSKDPDYLKKFISIFHAQLEALGLGGKPLYLTEWNSTISHRDLLNDTCFKAPYIVKNILENYDDIDSFGYWVLSDLLEEFRASHHLFHGGLGIFTSNGIKKPAYHAYSLLSRLGDTLIARGEGYFITKGHGNIQIMLYNYQHYSDLYASGELFDVTYTNRYSPFVNKQKRDFLINLINMDNGEYMINEFYVNRHNGSVFDKWIQIGAEPLTTPEEMKILENSSTPMLNKSHYLIQNGKMQFAAELDPLEVRLVEIKPML